MSDLNIRDLYLAPPEAGIKECTVSGWVRTVRDSKAFGFIELNDGSCFRNLQVVMEAAALSNYADIASQNVGAALIVTGFLLFLCDRVRKGRKTERSATWLDALLVGVGQAVATLPGVSRSGMTITAGCFVGYERRFAVRFSFLLSIPAVLGANILSLSDAAKAGINTAEVPMYLLGVVTAAVSGYLCIRLLKYVADKGRFGAFAYYCWAVGILTLVLQAVK